MSVRYFWRTLCHDIKEFVKTCQTCQFSKNPTNKQKSPLRPLPVATRPMEFISFDHKRFTRVTNEGNTYVLAFICHFSGYVVYAAVPDESALTTTKTFLKYIIGPFGNPRVILSDKGSGYMSTFFAYISNLLGVTHKTYAAMASRTNGYAEQAIKRLNEDIIRYSTPEIDDRDIEQLLPIIQMSILATTNEITKISPYEILHGFPIPLPCPITGGELTFFVKRC